MTETETVNKKAATVIAPTKKSSIFSSTIIRLLALFMTTLILFTTVQIVVEQTYLQKIKQQNGVVARQQAKRKLGVIIKEKITTLELYFHKSLTANNKHAREILFRQAGLMLNALKKILPVLQYGGTYTLQKAIYRQIPDAFTVKIG